ncbi:gamma-glutamylcyclotransferase-like [Drosophila sulfurigaster albostrigata]|uniref:gamma-glutamylcyclotransferase-like n=1 Tax=Drosophila sulfurigaster albostrigata TaxID=89887 RepID=UPI002D21DB9D|nr:gamma-glutamylcyclotransferase-like [Drosophila sulfurigaster albostrigata]
MKSLIACVIILFGVSQIYGLDPVQQLPEVNGDKFFYFGFGSNMLAKRIHIQNPTAEIIGPALLEDYRVDFSLVSEFWKGAVATIVPSPGSKTWGTLWVIDLTNLADLDNQERVHLGWYKPVSVQVKLQNNVTEIPARLYVITNEPKGNVHDLPPSEVPEDRQPSKTYLQVLVKGAIDSGLPEEYVTWLKGFKHNNQTVQHLEELLELQSVAL